ncbi:transposable element Tcb2 transposase [Trichonephila inaurata madagascariensis]|uniref:Transposable element Tcb2 transposase n=1 Tax=Trichonephila inaurata madagascariensis TaxID=2747483 RepID=A0A8X6XKR4_9ARAC|nr:transposable element Tcb2 transposase [Trichonephila inaurata madagascariensis]
MIADGRVDLRIIRIRALTGRRCMDEVFRPIVVPYTAAIGDDVALMDDSCRPHRDNLKDDFLFEEGITRMEWIPDRHPIERVWDILGI